MTLKSLGNKIRIIRTQRGLNQYNMADELQISDVAYSKIERGLTNVSITRLSQIANCLNISLSQLVGETDKEIITGEEKGKNQTDGLENRIRDLEIKVEYLLNKLDRK